MIDNRGGGKGGGDCTAKLSVHVLISLCSAGHNPTESAACQQDDFPLSQPINALNMIKTSMNNIDFRYINRVGNVFINEEEMKTVRTYHFQYYYER